MLLKSHQKLNDTPNITRSSDSLSTVPPIVNTGDGMHCARPGDYHSLSLTHIKFHPQKVTPLTNLDDITAQNFAITLTTGNGTTTIKVES